MVIILEGMDTMSLAKDLDTIRVQGEALIPPDAVATLQGSVEDLSRSGIVDCVSRAG